MKFTKKTIYVGLFAILYLIVAFSSFFHACAFFGLANNDWMSIILAFAFEVGQAAVLFSLLTSTKDRGRIMPWVLMIMFTLVQVIGNVYSSYKYIITNSVENLRYFKEPIFIWTDLPDAQANVIIVYLVGALLPIAALLLTSMITNYLTDQSTENNSPIFVPEITSENVTNNPIEIKDEPDGPPEGEGLSERQEIENLNATIDNRDEEIDKLKQELEELKHSKIISQSTNEPNSVKSIENIEDENNSENSTSEDTKVNETVDTEEQTTELEIDKSVDEQDNKNDENEQLVENKEIEKMKKPSHFINL